jgi:CarD family transcriptional regulator
VAEQDGVKSRPQTRAAGEEARSQVIEIHSDGRVRKMDRKGAGTMFLVGDEVVHRVHGAGIITQKKEMQITETSNRYLVIEMPESDSTLMVPTDKAEQFLRPVSKMMTLRHLLTDILTGQPNMLPKDYRERAEQIGNKLKSGEIKKWIEVVRDLTYLREQRPLCQTDRRGLERARHLLTAELALAQGIDQKKAEILLMSIIERRHELKEQQVGTSGWLETLRQRIIEPFTKGDTQATAGTRWASDKERSTIYAQDQDTQSDSKTVQDHRQGKAAPAETEAQPSATQKIKTGSSFLL